MSNFLEWIDLYSVGVKKLDDDNKRLIKLVNSLIKAVNNKKGKVIDGDPKKVREVTDIWTFAKEVASRDPNWKLVATEAAN